MLNVRSEKNNKLKINLLGLYLVAMLLGLTSIALLTYIFKMNDSLIESLIYIACAGGLGGTIYPIRGYYRSLAAGVFDFDKWAWWYIFRPLISVVIGVFSYFLIVGGLLNFNILPETDYSKGIMFYLAISFLAGFCFSQFADNLDKLGSKIFAKKKVYKNEH